MVIESLESNLQEIEDEIQAKEMSVSMFQEHIAMSSNAIVSLKKQKREYELAIEALSEQREINSNV
jgi:septation ring formation regulator EzrA